MIMTLMTRVFLVFCFFYVSLWELSAQQLTTGHSNDFQYEILDNFRIGLGVHHIQHASIRPYSRLQAVEVARSIDTSSVLDIRGLDRMNKFYLFRNNNEWLGPPAVRWEQGELVDASYMYFLSQKPFLGSFYRTPANAVEWNGPSASMRLNPVLSLYGGYHRDRWLTGNEVGMETRAVLGRRFYFDGRFTAVQQEAGPLAQSTLQRQGYFPGSDYYTISPAGRYQFLRKRFVAGYRLNEFLDIQTGYGNHFIGNGVRSVFLSDGVPEYFYLQGNMQAGIVHYQTIFAQLQTNTTRPQPGEGQKYTSVHYLSVQVSPRFRLGLFEYAMFAGSEFELSSMMPLLGLRTLERATGINRHTALGLDAEWLPVNGVALYGQLLVSNISFREWLIERRGWMGNRSALQLGAKYYHAWGVRHLDFALEYNTARPFTYAHSLPGMSWSHAGSPLAHELGANFREFLLRIRYQPQYRWVARLEASYAMRGESFGRFNYGEDILIPASTMLGQYEHYTVQGIAADRIMLYSSLSYQYKANLFFDLHAGWQYFQRTLYVSGSTPEPVHFPYAGLGIRLNVAAPASGW